MKTKRVQRRAILLVLSLCLVLTLMPGAASAGSTMVRIRLTAGNVWGDGTGYQLLLFAPGEMPKIDNSSPIKPGDSAPYDNALYKIPSDADASDDHDVINNSISIDIPAGNYDYVILNPNCLSIGVIYVASDQGYPSKESNYEFESGKQYEFSMSLVNSNDYVTRTFTLWTPSLSITETEDGGSLALAISDTSALGNDFFLFVARYNSDGKMTSVERVDDEDFLDNTKIIPKNDSAMVKAYLLTSGGYAPAIEPLIWQKTP